jgi:uncharacterized protein YyaL (SSP411 family)
VRLAQITENEQDTQQAAEVLSRLVGIARSAPLGHTSILNALDLHLRGVSILVTGNKAEALFGASLRVPYLDRSVRRVRDVTSLDENHPAKALASSSEEAQALVCAGMRCSLPVSTPETLRNQVEAMLAG